MIAGTFFARIFARCVSRLRRSGVFCYVTQPFRVGLTYAAPTALGLGERIRLADGIAPRGSGLVVAAVGALRGSRVMQRVEGFAAEDAETGAQSSQRRYLLAVHCNVRQR